MSNRDRTKPACSKCGQDRSPTICSGCEQQFCFKHIDEHRKQLLEQINQIDQEYNTLKQNLDGNRKHGPLLAEIDRWEKKSIEAIQSTAETARKDLQQLSEQSNNQLIDLGKQLTRQTHLARENKNVTEKDLNQLQQQFEDFRKELDKLIDIELLKDDAASLRLIKIRSSGTKEQSKTDSSSQYARDVERKQSKVPIHRASSHADYPQTPNSELSPKMTPSTICQSSAYPIATFGLHESADKDTQRLFDKLMLLQPMDKDGPMSGKCSLETDQMEQFLAQTFGFINIPGKSIVQGVKSFQLGKPPHRMVPSSTVYFPRNSTNSFAMTVQEIIDWQRSYKVYAGKDVNGMTKEFLYRALQGQSGDGEEAFRMKFVVRISKCPILMEFDGKIISRSTNEDWPNRIKLVSVTGIDFAGRKHDVGDILCYVTNWKEVFEVDHKRKEPALLNERDFCLKKGGALGELHETRLLADLTYMARLRLRACDAEGVEIVVETGIGLGVFSGTHIGIDAKVRVTSAIAIRTVLEQDGPSYKNIRGIVFALPIFNKARSDHRARDTFHDFVDQFHEPLYNGPIPVLIADQDMHRLTVAIARLGFTVSELNPADSHGVFGEYWQNRGPAVEEKLALTTVGLLVQHHLINPHVFDPNNYRFI
jgi:hypothetical protein